MEQCFASPEIPMNSRIFPCSLVSALAGFLFGFDTVVISGAEKTIQSRWSPSPAMHGLRVPFLPRHDGDATHPGESHGAGDEGRSLEEIQRDLGIE